MQQATYPPGMESPSVFIGSAPSVVLTPVPNMVISTNVQGMAARLLEQQGAAMAQQRKPNTPYQVQAWKAALDCAGLVTSYPEPIHSSTHGFHAGTPPVTHTFIPPNCPSVYAHSDAFYKHLRKGFSKGRYLGPFTQAQVEAQIGFLQTSPLSFVPKATPGEFRAINNFSHPHKPAQTMHGTMVPSINSHIQADDFPCLWGTFDTFELLAVRLPPGCQASCRNISEAYRTVPLAASQWPGTVVRVSEADEFAINTANSRGLVSGGGVFGRVADALADILRASGIGPIIKWVDDFCFVRLPQDALARYNEYQDRCRNAIKGSGDKVQERPRVFYHGRRLPGCAQEKFDDDMVFPLSNGSNSQHRCPEDDGFAYGDGDIDAVTDSLGIIWAEDKHLQRQCAQCIWASVGTYDSGRRRFLRRRRPNTSRQLRSFNAIEEWYPGAA